MPTYTELFNLVNELLRSNGVKEMLMQADFDIEATQACSDLLDLANTLIKLSEAKILTQANFDAIKEHELFALSRALVELSGAEILTQANFDATQARTDSLEFTRAIAKLSGAKILTQANFDAIKEHTELFARSCALVELSGAEILTQANFDAIAHTNLTNITNVLYALNTANILTQANFDSLLDPNNQSLFSDVVVNELHVRMPSHLLTQAVFEQLIAHAQQPNPEAALLHYIAQLLNNRPEAGMNNAQSTHTASVHASVSKSAKNLWSCYGEGLSDADIEKTITAVKDTLSHLPITLKHEAAKRCVERITAFNDDFTDPTSKVSLRQLLVISYLAIRDADRRIGSIEDAEDAFQQFIEGLYEIQRGYNLSAKNVDDGKKDKPICIAGTFNKLIEKLCGIHSTVELIFMTEETVACKFPIVVREEANDYLKKLSKPETSKDFLSFMKLIEQLLKEGIDIIWNEIKPSVADRLFDEFKSLYANNKENPHFEALIDTGVYVELGNLQDYRQSVMSSPGYREYSSQMLQSNARFFSQLKTTGNYLCVHRHDNAKAQRES